MAVVMVTGGSGLIGSNVSRKLVQEGHKVILVDNRKDTRLIPDLVDSTEIIPADILDLASLTEIMGDLKVERVVHLAALMGSWYDTHPIMCYQVNLGGTLNVLEAARANYVKRVVLGSSRGVIGKVEGTKYGYPAFEPVNEDYIGPRRPLAVMKVACEFMGLIYSRNQWVDTAALRFGDIYCPERLVKGAQIQAGVFTDMILNAYLGRPTDITSSGDEVIDPIYVKDCAHAVVLACFAENLKHRIYNIGSGHGVIIREAAEIIKKVFPSAMIKFGTDFFTFAQGMDANYCVLDITRAKEDLRFKPNYSLEDGIKDFVGHIEFFRKHGVDLLSGQSTYTAEYTPRQ
jgi:nucleoside-diphosphate-sugar epimerase